MYIIYYELSTKEFLILFGDIFYYSYSMLFCWGLVSLFFLLLFLLLCFCCQINLRKHCQIKWFLTFSSDSFLLLHLHWWFWSISSYILNMIKIRFQLCYFIYGNIVFIRWFIGKSVFSLTNGFGTLIINWLS